MDAKLFSSVYTKNFIKFRALQAKKGKKLPLSCKLWKREHYKKIPIIVKFVYFNEKNEI